MFCWASVSTFTNRTFPERSLETSENTGAKPTHGLHQGAQKSTTTGCSLCKIVSRFNSVPSTGAPSKSGDWHLPHFGLSETRSAGTRLTPEQDGQRVLNVDMTFSLLFVFKCDVDIFI